MKKIYKYVTPDRVDILKNLQIRITQPKYLNDPFDSLISFKKIVEKELFTRHFNPEAILKKALSKLDDQDKIRFQRLLANQGLSIEDIKQKLKETFDNQIDLLTTDNVAAKNLVNEELNNFMGIICFTETPDNIPMWAHYADVHQGFVIEFDAEHDFFNSSLVTDIDFGYLKKVNYCENKTVWDTFKDIKITKGIPFFEKHISWSYEKEWRILLPLSVADNMKYSDIFLVNLHPEAIKGVIFGFRCKKTVIETITGLFNELPIWSHLKLFVAKPQANDYRMQIEEIKSNYII